VKADGTLWAWGNNTAGQLGLPATTASTTRPTQVGTATDWLMVAAGEAHSLALKADGTLWAWGNNRSGQLGNTTNLGTDDPNPTPTQVAGTYARVAAGPEHSLAVRADGSLWAWGSNVAGQLGSSTPNKLDSATPLQVPGTYTQASGGFYFSIGLRADGSLWSWGYNYFGQLGNSIGLGVGNPAPNPTPAQVAGTWKQAITGNSHTMALKADGSLWAWGNNLYGQLGNATNSGTELPNATPTQAPGTYTQVAAGFAHSLALKADGTLWTWGDNRYGQLGLGTTTSSTGAPTPTQEATLGTGWATLATGCRSISSLARTASGLAFASTGNNGAGQLGDGTTTDASRFDRLSPLSSFQLLPVRPAGLAPTTLVLAPNPAQGAVRALGLPAGATLAVYNALGQLVRPAAAALDVAGLPAGVYVVRAQVPGAAPQAARLVIE